MTLAVKPLNLYIAAVSTTSSASESESGCCTSSDEEVWDLFDSEDEEEPGEDIDGSLNQTISAVSFFLLFYHLTYHLSERAVNALIGFLRTFFSVVTGHAVLVELVHTFPDYIFTKNSAITEHAVCPKWNSLYKINECILSNGESKRCSFVDHPHPSRHAACSETLLKSVKIGDRSKLAPKKVYMYHSVIAKQKGFPV